MRPQLPLLILLFVFFASAEANAQKSKTPKATSAEALETSLAKKQEMTENSLVKKVPFKNIGPTVMSGRVVDVDVNPENSTDFYVGYATGGIWHTTNNGITFESVFDSAPTQNIGDIAVDWENNILYAGTGETISSRSSYAGIGLLRSTDGGKTWENLGLRDTHHISDILIDPNNPNLIIVGALGHLYSSNEERGVFKTTDGGQTWEKTLFVSDDTGVISLIAAPENSEILYAAAWDRDRKAWDFRGSGEESGIYKSEDRGDSWMLITDENGFPKGDGVGRIGLAAVDANTVYAIHDSQFRRPVEEKEEDEKEKDALQPEDFEKMSTQNFLDLDPERLMDYLKSNRFPRQYDAEKTKELVKNGEYKPEDFFLYTYDKNSVEYDSEVIGAEVYKTTDGGRTWSRTHDGFIDDLFYSYGYVFAEITVNPQDPEQFYLVGVPLVKSNDGGKTFEYINEPNLHVDHHVLWIDPKMPQHLINGNDGGLNISYDGGKSWMKNNSMPLGQFYDINVDYQKPYNVYGGLQDNGTWMGPHTYEASKGWEASGEYPYKQVGGGDGMQVQIDRRNPEVIYVGSQFGYYNRVNLKTGDREYIRPSHGLGETPYRFNWETPILLSPHNQDILYMGSNKLMRSMDQGKNWESISPDLTTGGKKGNVPYGTLTAISESPLQFGLLYSGSDDGMIQVSRDGGVEWKNISSKLPQNLWVSEVVASSHKKGRVYATLNGYRWDDFTPYVFVSEDFGESWKNISSNLPEGAVNVIAEDPKKEDLLYLGTDDGVYVSLDRGNSWTRFDGDLPKVAVHDVVVQTEANDLVIGTHGRSIFIADLEAVQEFDFSSEGLQVLAMEEMNYSSRWGESGSAWRPAFTPEAEVVFFSPKKQQVTVTLNMEDGTTLKQFEVTADEGINYTTYDLSVSEDGKEALRKAQEASKKDKDEDDVEDADADAESMYLLPGTYTLKLNSDGGTAETQLKIKERR